MDLFVAPGSQESNQANDFSLGHTKGTQVLTMLTRVVGRGMCVGGGVDSNQGIDTPEVFSLLGVFHN